MFSNLLKHSIRSFKRQRAYIIINILGLSIGIACSLLIALYVINEAGYDKFNLKKDRIYRLVLNGKIGGQEILGSYTCAPIGPTMTREFPEVEGFLRIHGWGPMVVEYKDQTFTDENVVAADSSFFNVFSIPLIKGDPVNALNSARKAVITESMAKKIFGDEDPIDKALKLGDDTARYIITGLMADVPEKSHFDAHILVSFVTMPVANSTFWLSNSFSTYLLLKPNTNSLTVSEKMPAMLEKYVGPELQRLMGITIEQFANQGNKYNYFLQKLTEIHLDPSISQEFKAAADPKYLYIFGSISILIVLIAAINFMNLATAQATRRSKEVGIKKVGGSTRGVLISQFLVESFILAFLALLLALLIIWLTLPYFNNLLGTQLKLNLIAQWYAIPGLLLFTIIVGFLSGTYPAFFLSSFNPVEVLKGSMKGNTRHGGLRKVLVVFQFAVSILLITATLVMYRQIFYMLNKDVGFNKEQMLVINRAQSLETRVEAFKNAVSEIPGVINITSSTALPGRINNTNGYGIEGRKDESFLMVSGWIDYDFIETYGMTLAEGRNFDKTFTTDRDACIINESAAKNFGITDISKTRFLRLVSESGDFQFLQVIGIVKNFNFESLRNPIQPYVFLFKGDENLWGYVTVKLSAQNYQSTITEIENRWKEFTSNDPMQYYFIDEDFEQMYRQEKQNAQLAVIFSVLAIFIAALGLFGLTSFTVEQRTKEIGVRKAMGSSITGIYFVISREIILLVTISSLISWPIVYFIAKRWLENFYYRIDPGVFSFLIGLVIALGIALTTISYRIVKAARINPAQSLKYE
ncbi:MAG TPA: FtsX-like permease family protein [Bacteroidales bacterium]|nr:FtsX-like permease family protein [Bacteroidales bacterium]HUV01613.1 FtsX-like permease family protein [Bacteroidales bacterium]